MSVYVDELRPTARTKAWPFTMAAHMLADTIDELHAMAEAIGLRREWFQPRSTPHYDLTASRHKLALARGAKRISRVELVALLRRLRAASPAPAKE
jgi:hypothetical protein